jgi:hypothetical protein
VIYLRTKDSNEIRTFKRYLNVTFRSVTGGQSFLMAGWIVQYMRGGYEHLELIKLDEKDMWAFISSLFEHYHD